MRLKPLLLGAAAAAVSSLIVSAAAAKPLLFTFTGADNATFQLDSNPVPDSSNPYSFFTGAEHDGTLDGAPHDFGVITFYSNLADGGLSTRDGSLYILSDLGKPFFSGSTSSPTFTPESRYSFDGGTGNLVISTPSVSAAPEPSTWALMIAGVGLIGASFRFSRRKGTLATA